MPSAFSTTEAVALVLIAPPPGAGDVRAPEAPLGGRLLAAADSRMLANRCCSNEMKLGSDEDGSSGEGWAGAGAGDVLALAFACTRETSRCTRGTLGSIARFVS